MGYSFEQVADIITDAVIRADWKNVSFRRDRQGVSVIFSNLFLEDSCARCESDFYKKYNCDNGFRNAQYSTWEEDEGTIDKTEDEWFAELEKYFSEFCGIHLKAEEKTA